MITQFNLRISVKQAGKDISYTGVLLLGFAVTGIVLRWSSNGSTAQARSFVCTRVHVCSVRRLFVALGFFSMNGGVGRFLISLFDLSCGWYLHL